ncbi:MAG: hypothetical protein ACPGU3_06705 [Litorivicinus sp.]
MKAMLGAFATALLIAYGATLVLPTFGWSSAERGTAAESVRLD